jgi:hypothetical protein
MSQPKGFSLHIGLNSVDPGHYGGWSGDLVACEADAEDMHAVAAEKGYTSTLLKTKDATREAVISHIRSAAQSLDSRDMFFLSYSGHGGQLPDLNGDEYDLEDETWCLYDGELIDDELRLLWGEFAEGVRVLVVSDSCHSGTVTKMAYYRGAVGVASRAAGTSPQGEQIGYRFMPPDVALRTYRENRDFYDEMGAKLPLPEEMLPIKASVRLLSGCQDNQYSMDGMFNGLFTGTLLRVWSGGRFRGDYQAFHRQILNRMPPDQSPNHYFIGVWSPDYDAQKPFTI